LMTFANNLDPKCGASSEINSNCLTFRLYISERFQRKQNKRKKCLICTSTYTYFIEMLLTALSKQVLFEYRKIMIYGAIAISMRLQRQLSKKKSTSKK